MKSYTSTRKLSLVLTPSQKQVARSSLTLRRSSGEHLVSVPACNSPLTEPGCL